MTIAWNVTNNPKVNEAFCKALDATTTMLCEITDAIEKAEPHEGGEFYSQYILEILEDAYDFHSDDYTHVLTLKNNNFFVISVVNAFGKLRWYIYSNQT